MYNRKQFIGLSKEKLFKVNQMQIGCDETELPGIHATPHFFQLCCPFTEVGEPNTDTGHEHFIRSNAEALLILLLHSFSFQLVH